MCMVLSSLSCHYLLCAKIIKSQMLYAALLNISIM